MYLPTSLHKQDVAQGQLFLNDLTGVNSEFF